MTLKQTLLRWAYPFLMWGNKIGKKNVVIEHGESKPIFPFHQLSITLANGAPFRFDILKGKKVLLVNTASDCGYTAQYKELQQLYSRNRDKLVVIAFPSNEFKEQEKGSNSEIETFCQKNFGVEFPVAQKCNVLPGTRQETVYSWLTNHNVNGWNKQKPVWNFCKYLVNEKGLLTHYFSPSVSPLGKEIARAIGGIN